jgi:hypothetical protein
LALGSLAAEGGDHLTEELEVVAEEEGQEEAVPSRGEAVVVDRKTSRKMIQLLEINEKIDG